jgi:nitrogen fixation protein NifX
MKVAFATKDLLNVDDHFGWAKQFAIYDITKDGYSLFKVATTDAEDPIEEDDKISAKLALIDGVSIIYCQAIGANAAARVVKAQIHPVKIPDSPSIESVLDKMLDMLKTNPPPWIRRIIAREEGLSDE